MKLIHVLLFFSPLLLFSCKTMKNDEKLKDAFKDDSLALVKMVRDRAIAREKHDIIAELSQFSDDATFINSDGLLLPDKKAIEKHLKESNASGDSSETFEIKLSEIHPPTGVLLYRNFKGRWIDLYDHYIAGNIKIRIIDKNNALVYYPWRIDSFLRSNPKDTIISEIGLMTLSAQRRNDQWFWIAITNQHTPEYFNDLDKHLRNR
jgi:hypothetical protein